MVTSRIYLNEAGATYEVVSKSYMDLTSVTSNFLELDEPTKSK